MDQTIKSYLVSLGWAVNQSELRKFQDALKQASRMVEGMSGGMMAEVAKAGAAIVSTYAAIGAATIGLLQRTAEADLGYRMFARRMYMGEDAAKRLKIALDSLGVSQEDVVWGPPELARRFRGLMNDQVALQAGLGPDFKGNMEQMRNYFNEFNRAGVAIQYLLQSIAQDIQRSLGPEIREFFGWLQRTNDYLIAHLPEITAKFDEYLVPVLHDTYSIFKDIVSIAREFLRLISLSGKETDGLENLLAFVRAISQETRNIFDELAKEIHMFGSLAKAVELVAFGRPSEALKALKDARDTALTLGPWEFAEPKGRDYQPAKTAPNDMRGIAGMVSQQTGIPAHWLYGQMAFETGNFTSRLFKQQRNIAGLTIPGVGGFRNFASFDEAAREFARVLNLPQYSAARGAKSLQEYVAGLGAGHYFGNDDPGAYLRGVQRFAPTYYTNSPTVNVNVAQPNASALDIAREVMRTMQEHDQRQVSRNALQLQKAYR
jgi:hypothetical protein